MNVRVICFTTRTSDALCTCADDVECTEAEIMAAATTYVPMHDAMTIELSPAVRFFFARAYPTLARTALARMLAHITQWTDLLVSSSATHFWICDEGAVPSALLFSARARAALCECMKTIDALCVGIGDCLDFCTEQSSLRLESLDMASILPSTEDVARSYIISKAGARRLLDHIYKNGVHSGGLDAVLLQCPDFVIRRASHSFLSKNARLSPVPGAMQPLDLTFGERLIFIEAYDVIGCDVGARPALHPIALLLRPQAEWDAVNTLGFYKKGAVLPRAWVRFPSRGDGVFIRSTCIDCDTQFAKQTVRTHGIICPSQSPYAQVFRPPLEHEAGDAFCVPAAASHLSLTTAEELQTVLPLPAAARVRARCNWDPAYLDAFVRTLLPHGRQWGRFVFVEEHEPADFIVYFANVAQCDSSEMELRLDIPTFCDAHRTLVFPILDFSTALKPIAPRTPIWPSSALFLHVHSLAHYSTVATWQHLPPTIQPFESLTTLGLRKTQKPIHNIEGAFSRPILLHYDLNGKRALCTCLTRLLSFYL